MAKLNEMVKEFRLSINQSAEAIAMMLQISKEQYEELESNWVPPDEFLKQMCSLFEWNYNDIKRIAQNTAVPSKKQENRGDHSTSAPSTEPSSFHKLLRQAREQAGQPPETIAMLLNIPVEYYQTFEEKTIPTDELIRKICTLFSWNYNDTRQQIINRSTPRITTGTPPLSLKEFQERFPKKDIPTRVLDENEHETLASRLISARTKIGQSSSGISLLLNISEDYYLKLESGTIPEPELLKRITALFQWNYNEVRLLVQNEKIFQFQPRVTKLESTSGLPITKLQTLLDDLKKSWSHLQKEKQELLLVQMEIIRDTAKRWQSP
ncbi:MAG: helix-turn-helix transcriptional regulator [SAR324 cluster bacterium]|nr:helix-turn-helix transcriptional regulator [SAR324 cluster bacterium]